MVKKVFVIVIIKDIKMLFSRLALQTDFKLLIVMKLKKNSICLVICKHFV